MSWFQPSFMPIVSALGIGLMVGLERERKKDRKTDSSTIAGLRTLNDMLEGTRLPRLDPEQIEALIHRDSLSLLGLHR